MDFKFFFRGVRDRASSRSSYIAPRYRRVPIFLLTSFFIDSIHSINRNDSFVASMKNGRENRTMATKKGGKKKGGKKKH